MPLYKLNPSSATKFVTPQKRGYGFSYSTFGTPTSVSSAASTPGGLGQSLLGGGSLSRGLSKSISSSSLRRTYNPDDSSILSPGAFANSSGPRYYGSTGSVKKLVINRDIRNDLFTTPSKDKQPATEPRKLTKRVSFDTSVPAIENGGHNGSNESPNASTSSAPAELGFIRPVNRANGINSTKAAAPEAPPEMEQVKGNELAIVHEEDSPALQTRLGDRGANIEAGEYWMSPSKDELLSMNRVQRQQVSDFTVGRRNIAQIRFRVPVDLSAINVDDIPGGIIDLQIRSATVYPVAAKKPPVGKGLNVPAEISLEQSWPRGGAQEKNSQRVHKHIERLKKIEDTDFINYDPHTGVWIFSVEHFTTYGLDYDDETETDVEPVTDSRTWTRPQPCRPFHLRRSPLRPPTRISTPTTL